MKNDQRRRDMLERLRPRFVAALIELALTVYEAYQFAKENEPQEDPLDKVNQSLAQLSEKVADIQSKLTRILDILAHLDERIRGAVQAELVDFAMGEAKGWIGNIKNYLLTQEILTANQDHLQTALDNLTPKLTYIFEKRSGLSDFLTLAPYVTTYCHAWSMLYRIKPAGTFPSVWQTSLHKLAMQRFLSIFEANRIVCGDYRAQIAAMPQERHAYIHTGGGDTGFAPTLMQACYPIVGHHNQCPDYYAFWWDDQLQTASLSALRRRENGCQPPGANGSVNHPGWFWADSADGGPWANPDKVTAARRDWFALYEKRLFFFQYFQLMSDADEQEQRFIDCATPPPLVQTTTTKLIFLINLGSPVNVEIADADSCDGSRMTRMERGVPWPVRVGEGVRYRVQRNGAWSEWVFWARERGDAIYIRRALDDADDAPFPIVDR